MTKLILILFLALACSSAFASSQKIPAYQSDFGSHEVFVGAQLANAEISSATQEIKQNQVSSACYDIGEAHTLLSDLRTRIIPIVNANQSGRRSTWDDWDEALIGAKDDVAMASDFCKNSGALSADALKNLDSAAKELFSITSTSQSDQPSPR